MVKNFLSAIVLCMAALSLNAQVKVYTCPFEEGLSIARKEGKLVLVNCTSPGG